MYIQKDMLRKNVVEVRSLEHTRIIVVAEVVVASNGMKYEKYYRDVDDKKMNVWSDSLADATVFTNINVARKIAEQRQEKTMKHDALDSVTVTARLVQKKDIMIARLRGSKNE